MGVSRAYFEDVIVIERVSGGAWLWNYFKLASKQCNMKCFNLFLLGHLTEHSHSQCYVPVI